jgi:hypothetical protein
VPHDSSQPAAINTAAQANILPIRALPAGAVTASQASVPTIVGTVQDRNPSTPPSMPPVCTQSK